MKILLLMPIDEKWSFMAAAIFNQLSDKAKDACFSLAMFSEWQIVTKKLIIGADLPINWNTATFGSLMKAKEWYKQREKDNKDCIIIGNVDASLSFDAVFNFQDEFEDLKYKDLYIEKLQDAFKDTRVITNALTLHKQEESKMTLHNIAATATFISAYCETDPHLEEIKKKYSATLKFKEKEKENEWFSINRKEL